MKIIAVMPIKLNNERLPGKNTKILGDKPLLQYELENLKKTNLLESINVFCSNEEIISFLPKGINFIKRPEYLDLPTSNFTQIFEEFSKLIDADIYVCINGDEPLIEPDVIEKSLPDENDINDLEYFYSNIITTITNPVEVVDPTNIKAVANAKGDAMWASRSPIPYPKGNMQFEYKKIVGIAAFSKKALQFYVDTPRSQVECTEELDLYRFLENGKKVKLKEIECHTLSVDTPKDLEKVREVIQKKIDKEG